MNANMIQIMKRTICSLSFGICLSFVSAADASAHDVEYRPHIAYDNYVYGRSRSIPGWLKRNREFRHWYMHSRYRFMHYVTWHRVYDRYRFEQRYRWHNGKFHGKVYRDDGYRTYQRKWKKRRY